MTSSKSDLEAKEGQIPNESNFLEFVSLLGFLSMRGAAASTQEEEGPENKEKPDAEEQGESTICICDNSWCSAQWAMNHESSLSLIIYSYNKVLR